MPDSDYDLISEFRIKSVKDILRIIWQPFVHLSPILNSDDKIAPLGRTNSGVPRPFSFGLWFRGQCDFSDPITPSAFRQSSYRFDEKNSFNELKLRLGSSHHNDMTSFEMLCLMRHHGLPARILDWSESPLVSLYFAISDDSNHDRDGVLTAMNAYRLNTYTSTVYENPGILSPTSFDVLHRSIMAQYMYYEDIQTRSIRTFKIRNDDIDKLTSEMLKFIDIEYENAQYNTYKENYFNKIRMPVAVIPKRNHPRMISQLSTFTVHGGKIVYSRENNMDVNPEIDVNNKELTWISNPLELDEINNTARSYHNNPFMIHFIVDKDSKPRIADELDRLGISAAMLFPEFEYQSDFVRKRWSFNEEEIPVYQDDN